MKQEAERAFRLYVYLCGVGVGHDTGGGVGPPEFSAGGPAVVTPPPPCPPTSAITGISNRNHGKWPPPPVAGAGAVFDAIVV